MIETVTMKMSFGRNSEMMRLNFERTSPSEHVNIRYHLGRGLFNTIPHEPFPSSHLTCQCKISRTFTVPSKSYRNIFQSVRMWNFSRWDYAILEINPKVD